MQNGPKVSSLFETLKLQVSQFDNLAATSTVIDIAAELGVELKEEGNEGI